MTRFSKMASFSSLLAEKEVILAILEKHIMAWTTPVVSEVGVGMEVTSYSSAEI